MIYIFVYIYNYQQMEKIKPDIIENLHSEFISLSQSCKCPFVFEKPKEGVFLFAPGEEEKSDPLKTIDTVFRIRDELDKIKEYLSGYNIIISIEKDNTANIGGVGNADVARNADVASIIAKHKKSLYLIEEENGVFIPIKDMDYFSKYVLPEKKGGFFRISLKKDIPDNRKKLNKTTWLRKRMFDRFFDELTPFLNGTEQGKIVFIHGRNGIGKTTVTQAILESVLKEDVAWIPRLYTRYKKRSFIHPFLNSINKDFLASGRQYLKPHEIVSWSNGNQLLCSLFSGEDAGISPDHLFEDFLIAYNLYLSAYVRMMQTHLKPAFLICDDLETYDERSCRILRILLQDFLPSGDFIPIFISKNDQLPEIFHGLEFKEIGCRALHTGEIRQLVKLSYPGLALSKKAAKMLYEYSKALVLPLKCFLTYAFSRGIIQKKGRAFEWTLPEEEIIPRGLDQLQILSFFISTFPVNELDIFYLVYLSAGMLTAKEFLVFLEKNSYQDEFVRTILNTLSEYGLVSAGEYITPYYPGLRKQVEQRLENRRFHLNDMYINYITVLWKSRNVKRYVLLFSLLITHNRVTQALPMLYSLIKRKINEGEIDAVKPFLSLKNPVIRCELNRMENRIFRMIVFSGQLEIAVIERKEEFAEKVIRQIMEENFNEEEETALHSYRAEVYLNMARYYHLKDNLGDAFTYVKKALLDYQDADPYERKIHAHIELGLIMLQELKIGDASEYFKLALRLVSDDDSRGTVKTSPLDIVKILIPHSISFYISGNISESLHSALEIEAVAGKAGIREIELYAVFFTGRLYFDLGLYVEAQEKFTRGLLISSAYSIKKAQKVLYAWLGRSVVYSGRIKDGIAILNNIKQGKESLFFLSEAYFFIKQFDRALRLIEKAMNTQQKPKKFIDEKIEWLDGFSLIEERYLKLDDHGSIFDRFLKAFRAYLLSLCSRLKEGLIEFGEIIKTGKEMKTDPFHYLYYFLYAQLLQKPGDEGADKADDYLTILNKALKQLQERASKIGEPSDRIKYLFNNFWNSSIFSEAKKKNLL